MRVLRTAAAADLIQAIVKNRFDNEALGTPVTQFSPDGRWLAYETNESGRPEIVAQGKESFFIAPDGKMMAVPVVTAGSTFAAGRPVTLFPTDIVAQPFKFQYTVSRDGRFIVNNLQPEESAAPPITLIFNWKP